MPSMLRPAAVFVACAAVLLLGPGRTRAADDDQAPRRAQAELLLQAMHTEQVLTSATTRVYQMVDRVSQNLAAQNELTPEQKTAAQKAQEDAHTAIGQQLSWTALKADFIQAYADAFTEDELKGLVSFYGSSLGQKLVEKQPPVTEKMGRLTQQKMMAVMPALIQKLKDSVQKSSTATPAPPAATASPAVPAPAVVPSTTPAP